MPTDAPRRRIVAVDEAAVETVLEGLRQEADRRKRVATRLAGEVIDTPAGKADQRPDALRIAKFLATASRLETVADALEAAEPHEPVDLLAPIVDADDLAEAADAVHDEVEAAAAIVAASPGKPGRTTARTRPATEPAPTVEELTEALDAMGMTEETPTP